MRTTTVIYNALFKRGSTFALTIVVGAFVFETGLRGISNCLFESINRGKLWHHIKDNYRKEEEETEAPPPKAC